MMLLVGGRSAEIRGMWSCWSANAWPFLLFVRFGEQENAQHHEQQVRDPGGKQGRKKLFTTEYLAGFDAAIVDEADKQA